MYAIIGLYIIDSVMLATSVPRSRWSENAHTRRILAPTANDITIEARFRVSGRLERALPIGGFRERAYRVFPQLLSAWGGLMVKNGYLQRSARLPEFINSLMQDGFITGFSGRVFDL